MSKKNRSRNIHANIWIKVACTLLITCVKFVSQQYIAIQASRNKKYTIYGCSFSKDFRYGQRCPGEIQKESCE